MCDGSHARQCMNQYSRCPMRTSWPPVYPGGVRSHIISSAPLSSVLIWSYLSNQMSYEAFQYPDAPLLRL